MPRVGDEQRDVSGGAFEDHRRAPVVGQVHVVHCDRTARAGPSGGFRARRRSARRRGRSPATGCARRSRTPDTGCGRPRARRRGGEREVRRRSARIRRETRADFARRCWRSRDSRRRAAARSPPGSVGARAHAGTPRCDCSISYRNSSLSSRTRSGGTDSNTVSISLRSSPTSASENTPRRIVQPSRSSSGLAPGASPR